MIDPRPPLKFYLALVVAAGFVVISLVAIGNGVHAWFETRDSIRHWEREVETAQPDAKRRPSDLSPKARLEADRKKLARIEEGFVAPAVVGSLFGLLVYLAWRKFWRKPRISASAA